MSQPTDCDVPMKLQSMLGRRPPQQLKRQPSAFTLFGSLAACRLAACGFCTLLNWGPLCLGGRKMGAQWTRPSCLSPTAGTTTCGSQVRLAC